MDDKGKIVLVTGANRGIGLEICRQLAGHGFTVVLTGRQERKVAASVADLQEAGFAVVGVPLDVTDQRSIGKAAEFVKEKFGRLDVLINNAGILIDSDYEAIGADPDKMMETIDINALGPLRVCQAMVPLMKPSQDARIINVSSHMGQLSDMRGDAPGYRMSKAALNCLTGMLADNLAEAKITVNSMSPGWVRTHMGGPDAPLSAAEGADTAVWLATCPERPTGKFFRERKEIPW